MKIFMGSDHAALESKNSLKKFLLLDHEIVDLGTDSSDASDYPKFAIEVVKSVVTNPGSRGILLCGSGLGMCMVANKFKGVRAAVCRDVEDAKLSRLHNDANILCLGARITSAELMKDIAADWLDTDWEGGRHESRLKMFEGLGSETSS
jgi:ribose 5-phosphate isomerase B